MVVQHNLTAMNGVRNLYIISGKNGKSTEKLSSGYRINRAGDDAAGLAISEKMRRQIRGLNQASFNVQDGVSLIQTAEGGLHEVHDILHRIRELSVKAANGTHTLEDREAAQAEIDALIEEVDRVSESTKFNNITLLNGSLDGRFGSSLKSEPQNLSIDQIKSMVGDDELGIIFSSTYEYTTIQEPLGGNTIGSHEELAKNLENQIVPQIVSSIMANYPAFSSLNGSTIGIGLRLYNQNSNVHAYVSASYSEQGGDGTVKGYKEYQLGVNLNHIRYEADGSLTAASRQSLEATIAHEMIHGFMAETMTNGMIGSDRFPLWFAEGMAQSASGPGNWLPNFQSDGDIQNYLSKIGAGYSSLDGAANYGTGYLASMYLGYMAGSGGSMESRILDGLNKIMSTVIGGKSLSDAIADHTKYNDLPHFSNTLKDDVDAYSFVKDLIAATGSGRGGLATGDLTDTDLAADADLTGVSIFKLYADKEKVKNTYSGNYVILSGGGAMLPEPLPGKSGPGGGYVSGPGGLIIQAGSESNDHIKISIDAVRADTLNIKYLSVTTAESAGWAMETCTSALNRVSQVRSNLGAYQNRLEHAAANLDNAAENTQAAESAIRDLNMAKETGEFSRSNILMQAAQALLAQSNQSNQGVLALLQ